jgi:hypothetical protein
MSAKRKNAIDLVSAEIRTRSLAAKLQDLFGSNLLASPTPDLRDRRNNPRCNEGRHRRRSFLLGRQSKLKHHRVGDLRTSNYGGATSVLQHLRAAARILGRASWTSESWPSLWLLALTFELMASRFRVTDGRPDQRPRLPRCPPVAVPR